MNDINELRAVLFETLRALNDKEKPMALDRAKTIAEVSQVVINSAKVEVAFVQATQSSGTGFLGEIGTTRTPTGSKTVIEQPGVRRTVHRLT